MSQQSLRQASVRAVTGTELDYNGDWHALFDSYGIATGDYNGRLLAWINQVLGASYGNVNDAMQAFAESKGAFNWSSLGEFSLFIYYDSSVNGSDANNGSSPALAFENLTAIPALNENDSIGLNYGSLWSEQEIDSAALNITIGAYGNSADGLPEIDGNDTATTCINLSTEGTEPRGHRISNVRARRATQNNGCIVAFGYAVVDGVEALEGTLHNMLLGWGSLTNSLIKDGGTGVVGSYSLCVFFTDEEGKSATIEGNEFSLTSFDADAAGLISHTASGQTYAEFVIRNNTFRNLSAAIAMVNVANIVSENDVFEGTGGAYTIYSDAEIINPTSTGAPSGGVFLVVDGNNRTVSIMGGTVCQSLFNTALFRASGTGLDFTAGGDLKIGATESSAFAIFFFDYGTIQIGTPGSVMELDTANIPYVGILGRGANDLVLTTPGQYVFSSASFALEINGTTYNNLAAMQAAGYFTNATVGTVNACA